MIIIYLQCRDVNCIHINSSFRMTRKNFAHRIIFATFIAFSIQKHSGDSNLLDKNHDWPHEYQLWLPISEEQRIYLTNQSILKIRQSMQIRDKRRVTRNKNRTKDISLWIDENQVKSFGGYNSEIFIILNGRVLPYILDPNFENHLPIIPSEVNEVKFKWRSDIRRKYYYNFHILKSSNKKVLKNPMVTIKKRGRVPRKLKAFSIMIPCVENATGVVSFRIGLKIKNKRKILPGMPLTLTLKKRCQKTESRIVTTEPDSGCQQKCHNGGFCDEENGCKCPQGYMGQFCQFALCYPQCQNGGKCSAPGKCSCRHGYHGRYCEGGICKDKCENGGKCVQKDTCLCRKGFFGKRCEFSKCVIPCVNGGKCRGANKCKCKAGFNGNHCEIIDHNLMKILMTRCNSKCRHGSCHSHGSCRCDVGFTGRWCRRRIKPRRKLWI